MAIFGGRFGRPAMPSSHSDGNCAKHRRRRFFIAVVAAAAIVAGQTSIAFAQQLYATPVTDPDKLYLMDGYSITPPRGQGWFEMKRDREYVYFGKRLSSPTQSMIAVAMSATVIDAIENVDAFRDYVVRQFTEKPADWRSKILIAEAAVDPAAGPFCVRYQMRTEDRGAANAGGRALLAETNGVSCLHPERKTLAIDVSYTERGLPAETGTALRNEGEQFVRGLKFLPYP